MFSGPLVSKTRVAFFPPYDASWMGGVNYYKNLFFALKKYATKEIEIIVFMPKHADKLISETYKTLVNECHFVDFIDPKRPSGYISKIENRLFKSNHFLDYCLRPFNLEIVSHSNYFNFRKIKTIAWIPDFQHLHLSTMFNQKEIRHRNNHFNRLIENSDSIILSSFDALNDFKNFAPKSLHKSSVLQFVSQPVEQYFFLNDEDRTDVLEKYRLPDFFYYLPNQFWKHKNHLIAFQAVKLLRDEGIDICLVCSGSLRDYRSPEYIEQLIRYIEENKLEKQIRLIGLIAYKDVFKLIKFSQAVINPSLFEGWSSTVEECKSVNKGMILSDLNVHKEQYPEALFFHRNSAESLSNIWRNHKNSTSMTTTSTESLEIRTKSFSDEYVKTILKVKKKCHKEI